MSGPRSDDDRQDAPVPEDAFLAALAEDDVGRQFDAAALLLASGRHDAAVGAYEQLAARHPDRRAECEIQLGAAHAARGRHREAAEHYAAARAAGADPAGADDRIWAACQALQVEAVRLYERLCPDGRHVSEAGRHLNQAVHQRDGHGAPIFELVAEHLTTLGLRFSPVAGETRFIVPFTGDHAQYMCVAEVDEERCFVLFYARCPLLVPADRRAVVADFLTRANYGMLIGNFELDQHDGEIRYKTSIDVEGAFLTEALMRPLVFASVATMDRYLPGVLAILYQDADAATAIELVEGGR